jgi:hypothetical protein
MEEKNKPWKGLLNGFKIFKPIYIFNFSLVDYF